MSSGTEQGLWPMNQVLESPVKCCVMRLEIGIIWQYDAHPTCPKLQACQGQMSTCLCLEKLCMFRLLERTEDSH